MAPKTDRIDITFNTTTHAIGITPDEIDVNYGEQDTITWRMDNSGATIQSINFPNGAPGTVSYASNGKSASLVDDDQNTTGADIEYSYNVTLLYNGTPYTSDPKIVNKPNTGGTGGQEMQGEG